MKRNVLVVWDDWKHHKLPESGWYSTVAKFPEDSKSWPNGNSWSVVLDFDVAPARQGSPSLGFARFLAEEGPHERLRVGTSIEMYEGHKRSTVVKSRGVGPTATPAWLSAASTCPGMAALSALG